MPRQDRNMRFLFINGQVEHFTPHELLRLFRHRTSITTLLIAGALIIWLRPYEGLSSLSAAQQVIYWGLVLPATFTAYLSALLLLARWRGTGYSIAGHFFAALVCAVLSPLLRQMLGLPTASWAEIAEAFGFTLVASAAIELFMVTYLANRIRPQPERPLWTSGFAPDPTQHVMASPPARPPETGEAPLPAVVVLLGRPFDPHDLRIISAEEHYVMIRTRTRQDLLRGRISDIEAQLPGHLGQRVHRSHWVATVAVRGLSRRREGWTLDTCLGVEVPVARGRRDDVRDWLRQAGIDTGE